MSKYEEEKQHLAYLKKQVEKRDIELEKIEMIDSLTRIMIELKYLIDTISK